MENLASHMSAQQRFLAQFGDDNQSWAALFQDHKLILEQLRSPDEMVVYEAVSNLQNMLSIAQDNTLSNFAVDQFIPVLLDILRRYPESDISNEINMMATISLTSLMDIYPNICNAIVQHGGVKCFTLVLERSMGFVDLNEACIKALEKISIENPHAVLTSGAIALVLNMIDFFEISTQKRIIGILLNISKHSASEADLNEHLLPIVPALCMFLHSRGGGEDSAQKVESVSLIVLKIFESIFRFISPVSQPDKIGLQIAQIGSTGIVDAILSALQDYQQFESSVRASQSSSPQKQDSSKATKLMSNVTIENFLKTLTFCCSYSAGICKTVLDENLLKILDSFLPSQEDQKLYSVETFPFIQETLQVLDSMLPSREDEVFLTPGSLPPEAQQAQQRLCKEKRALFGSEAHIVFLAERLLPKIFNVHENNVQGSIRGKTLSVIDKLILLFNHDVLTNFVEPYSFAKFIFSNMRTNHLPAILQCLQMVEKLMKSNPEGYTLALIREGISPTIKQFSTIEQLEKVAGVSFKEVEALDAREELLLHAKTALMRAPEGSDERKEIDRRMFEQTIHKYMELAKQSSGTGSLSGSRLQIQTGKSIVALAELLQKDFFANQSFLNGIYAKAGDELKTLQDLKKLAEELITEAKSRPFEFERNSQLIQQVGEMLTRERPLLSYEIKESGILDALNAYLTMTPKQIELWDQQRKSDNNEEQKKSDEATQASAAKAAAQLSKKQAKSYIWRLKLFFHMIVAKASSKQPIVELVKICHDIISQNDFLIFDTAAQQELFGSPFSMNYGHSLVSDPGQSMSALRQLTRRMRVTLVYDPSKSSAFQKKAEKAPTLETQPLMQKSQSHHPAFQHLADSSMGEELHSKVYIKRNFLYNELKQVLVSVEQCASLFLLEDFLRNRIRTMDDVKTLKLPQSYYSSRPGGRGIPTKEGRMIIDRALERMRQMIEGSLSRDEAREQNEEFANNLVEEIIKTKELSEMEQMDLLSQVEIHSLQLIDDFYAEHDESRMGGDGGMDEDYDMDERLNELQNTMQRLREIFRRRKIEQIRGLKKPVSPSKKEEDVEMSESQPEEEKRSEPKNEDVEMTDEEAEERQEAAQRRFVRSESDASAILIGASMDQSIKSDGDPFTEDLEQLIKANGEDIEFEFYVSGERMVPNQTIYEVLKIVENKARRTKDSGLGSILAALQGGDQITVHFAIKDKSDNIQKQRKDSIIEFAMKRERSKSEAVNDISGSAVNQFVQTLLEKEFSVFDKGELGSQDQNLTEKRQLQSALKVLKVLNFLCRNTNLFSTQGIKFLVSCDEELKQEGYQDLDLQVGLSQLHANLFHHHKLDAYILRNIQDPYNLISGQVSELLNSIFKTCSFLFPFQTRLLFFKLISFIGSIDMNRSIYFLRQFLKQKLGKQLPQEDKNAVKSQRQKVIVDRTKILDCGLNLLSKVSNRAFLEVEYKDEVGTGLGPTLEFYYLLAQEIKGYCVPQSTQNIWRAGMADNSLYPSPVNLVKIGNEEMQRVYDVFRLAGMMVAKSISDDKLIDLPLSPLFWDLVLGKKMTIFDLERLDPGIYKVFADLQVLANKKRDIEKAIHLDQDHKERQLSTLKTASGARVEDLSLAFTLPGYDAIEMRIDGKSTDVTLDNLQEYIDLTMHFLFHETIKVQLQAFRKGFNQIFPVDSLRPFSHQGSELEDIICGTSRNEEEWTSNVKLAEFIVPAHGFHHKSQQYQWLLRFITELSKEERRKFLKFVTGSPRLPNGGFGALDPKLTVVLKKPIAPAGLSQEVLGNMNDEILPSVMTCQNYVKLPAYTSYEVLKRKFEMAYNEGCNSFTLS